MENKVQKDVNSNKSKKEGTKFNVNIKGTKDIKMELLDFYNQRIKKLHIILLIVSVIIYVISFYTSFSSIKNGNYSLAEGTVATSFMDNIKENALLDLVIIIAGITPYCFLSIIGLAQSIMVINGLAVRYALGKSFMITLFLGGLIQLIGVSLCVAIGLYFCRLSTKKNKYYHHSEFGMDDIKMQVYEIRKDEKKIEEINKKKEEKAKKIEECNIKIPYLNFILLGAIAFVFQFIGVLITKI
jgi:hypothetical protein